MKSNTKYWDQLIIGLIRHFNEKNNLESLRKSNYLIQFGVGHLRN